MIELEVIDADRDQFMVRGNEPYRVETLTTDDGIVIAHVYRGEEIDKNQEPVGAYDGTLPNPKGWKFMGHEDSSVSYKQMKDALVTASKEAQPDWIDRDFISKAQDKLEEWTGVSMSETQLDLFAYLELGWEPSDYPADREWREATGTADIIYS